MGGNTLARDVVSPKNGRSIRQKGREAWMYKIAKTPKTSE